MKLSHAMAISLPCVLAAFIFWRFVSSNTEKVHAKEWYIIHEGKARDIISELKIKARFQYSPEAYILKVDPKCSGLRNEIDVVRSRLMNLSPPMPIETVVQPVFEP
jgi:hypothetical protein